MAPLMPLACAAFVSAWSFLFSGSSATTPPTVHPNTSLCLTGINLARSAKLDTRVPVVAADKNLEEEATKAITDGSVWSDPSTCILNDDVTPASLGGLLIQAAAETVPDANTITGLIQAHLLAGLTDLRPSYDATSKFDTQTFKTPSAQNLAHIMFTKSTKVGCVVTNNCAGGEPYIFCKFSEALTPESVPFSEALYKALEARKNASIVLTKLTDADLTTPLTPLTPETGGSSSAIPGAAIIFLSLIGLLATQ